MRSRRDGMPRRIVGARVSGPLGSAGQMPALPAATMTGVGRRGWRAPRSSFLMACLLLTALALHPVTAHGAAVAAIQGREVTLAGALALMPDTPAVRAAGVWYADYALARRVYGVQRIDSMADPRIDRFFTALQPLRPGPETGVSSLAQGRWRQIYGYDLLQLDTEIYSLNAAHGYVGVDVGRIDTAYIGHVLAAASYTGTMVVHDRLLVRTPAPLISMPNAALNAVALGAGRVIAGVSPSDVATASLRLQMGYGTLDRDSRYRALAAALGPVQGAYIAANVPPPLPEPSGGHRGPALHPFGLYALGYQELQAGQPVVEIALKYARSADAAADVATLKARLRHEELSSYEASWSSLATAISVSVQRTIVLVRLRLRPTTSPTLWSDAIIANDLSILSR